MKTNFIQNSVLAAALAAMAATNVQADQSMPAPKADKFYTVQVISVDPKESTFGVKSWALSSKQFNLGNNCTYMMVGKDNATIGDLRPGEKVTVWYQVSHGVKIADRVEQQAMRFEGMVAAIDPKNHSLILHQAGLDKPMQIADACRVQLRGDKSGTLADIRPGDHVTVTYETPNGEPTAQNIQQTSIEFTGKLVAIDLDQKTVKAKSVMDTLKFNLANNCAIVVNGNNNGKLSDLKPNDRLVFDYDNINGVNIVSRIAPAPPEEYKNATYTTTPGYLGYPPGY